MKLKPLLAFLLAVPLYAQVDIVQWSDYVVVTIDNKPFTNFFLAPGGNKPYFHPLRTANGVIVSRHFPIEKKEGEIEDHPHHRGMFFSHGDINGFDFWATESGPLASKNDGKMKTKRVDLKSGPKTGSITAVFDGLDPDGKAIMTETRTITFHSHPTLRIVDYQIRIEPLETLKFGDTKEGTFGIRLATSMQEDKFGGKMTISEGREGEKQVWGKRAPWLDYVGKVDGQTVGVAVFDHPSNPRHPTYWHTRAYGLLAANPFGVHDFEADPKKDGSLTIKKGEPITFRYRVVIHPGDTKSADIPALYSKYTAEVK
jgi:hypothetical protein